MRAVDIIIKKRDKIELTAEADPQVLLKKLIESGAIISKFEQIEPSLNDIFIEKVTA